MPIKLTKLNERNTKGSGFIILMSKSSIVEFVINRSQSINLKETKKDKKTEKLIYAAPK
jgi:hypothetical protein